MTAIGAYGLLAAFGNCSMTVDSCIINRIKSNGPGTIFTLYSNFQNLLHVLNTTIINCISMTSLINVVKCSNVKFSNNVFLNNSGSLFDVSSSSIIFENNFLENIIGTQPGALFNLDKFSDLSALNNNLSSVFNVFEGAFYLSNSNLTLVNNSLYDIQTEKYGGCIFGINSNADIKYLNVTQFKKGCIQFSRSAVILENFYFQTKFFELSSDSNCYSILCLSNCIRLEIIGTYFSGNVNNTLCGAVISIIRSLLLKNILGNLSL